MCCVRLGVEVGWFNGANGHIESLSNCLQHAVSSTHSLLILVENCHRAAAHKLFSALFFFFLSRNASHTSNVIFLLCFFFPPFVFEKDCLVMERVELQFVKQCFIL